MRFEIYRKNLIIYIEIKKNLINKFNIIKKY